MKRGREESDDEIPELVSGEIEARGPSYDYDESIDCSIQIPLHLEDLAISLVEDLEVQISILKYMIEAGASLS